jgi:hypothetical protein
VPADPIPRIQDDLVEGCTPSRSERAIKLSGVAILPRQARGMRARRRASRPLAASSDHSPHKARAAHDPTKDRALLFPVIVSPTGLLLRGWSLSSANQSGCGGSLGSLGSLGSPGSLLPPPHP